MKIVYVMYYGTPHDLTCVDTASIVCRATVRERARTAAAMLGRRHFERLRQNVNSDVISGKGYTRPKSIGLSSMEYNSTLKLHSNCFNRTSGSHMLRITNYKSDESVFKCYYGNRTYQKNSNMIIGKTKSERNTVYLTDTLKIASITNIQNCIDRSSSVKDKQRASEKCNIVRYHDNDTGRLLTYKGTQFLNERAKSAPPRWTTKRHDALEGDRLLPLFWRTRTHTTATKCEENISIGNASRESSGSFSDTYVRQKTPLRELLQTGQQDGHCAALRSHRNCFRACLASADYIK